MALKLLIVNDDGIGAEDLRRLVDWASTITDDITVAAPKYQQSAKSHSINIHSAYEIKKVEYRGAKVAYSVDSTPADCVRFALHLTKDYDLVLSGVNNGYNLGADIAYSGTCAAIFEAANHGLKAVAFSVHFDAFADFTSSIDRTWKFMVDHQLLEKGNLWNINLPSEPIGVKVTRQGGPFYQDWFVTEDGVMYHEVGHSVYEGQDATLDLDTDAVLRDHIISVSPLSIERTDQIAFAQCKGTKEEF